MTVSSNRTAAYGGVAIGVPAAILSSMNMAELMREVSKLSPDEQKQLVAYLVHLRLEQDANWRSEIARRVDDRTPSNWIDLEDWKKELGQNPER